MQAQSKQELGFKQEPSNASPRKEAGFTSEIIFKYVNLVVALILLFCIKGFLAFRAYCIQRGYYVFSTSGLIWCAVGFVGIFIFKYGYYYLMSERIEAIIHPKYVGEERLYKLNSVLKLSLDSIFYTMASILCYFLFREEYWFSSAVGGEGDYSHIFREYPNWPTGPSSKFEIYLMLQLGVHCFSVFEMVVIKGKQQRKYYEFMLHHCVAVSLILFSTMCNEIAACITTLFIHDLSDIMIAFCRAFVETKYQVKALNVFLYATMTLAWIYLRIIIFPLAILANLYINRPSPHDEWFMISFEYSYILAMALVLYGMHLFWTFFIIKLGVRSASGKKFSNVHDDNKGK